MAGKAHVSAYNPPGKGSVSIHVDVWIDATGSRCASAQYGPAMGSAKAGKYTPTRRLKGANAIFSSGQDGKWGA
jgi:hypothetical protein